jgi:hypothetical protein
MLEYRYSQLLTMVFIAMTFGAAMPIVYPFLVFTFMITYWIDKITVLRVYKKPPRYGKALTKVTREWLNLSIFIHFIVALWMYSNYGLFDTDKQNLFGWGSNDRESQVRDNYTWVKINEKVNQYHVFAYLIAFGFFILCFLFKTLLFNFFYKTCLSCCKKKNTIMTDLDEIKKRNEAYSNNFYKNLEIEHLQRLIDKTETEKEVISRLLTNPKYSANYEDAKDDIEWYVKRMDSMIEEMTLSMEVVKKNHNDSKIKKLYVHDYTYDIRDIRPYCDFLIDEDLIIRDDIEGKLKFN